MFVCLPPQRRLIEFEAINVVPHIAGWCAIEIRPRNGTAFLLDRQFKQEHADMVFNGIAQAVASAENENMIVTIDTEAMWDMLSENEDEADEG